MKMCSPMSHSSLSLPSISPLLFHRLSHFSFSRNPFFIRRRNARTFSVSCSIAEKNSTVELNWVSWDRHAPDEYNGWAIVEAAPKPIEKKILPKSMVIGVAASVTALLGFLAYSLSIRGFRFPFRTSSNALDAINVPSSIDERNIASGNISSNESLGDQELPEKSSGVESESLNDRTALDISIGTRKERSLDRIIVPFSVDSTQQEALLVLKKLKIIEDDAKADQLCTRREYARWLVRTNSRLERSRKHLINSFAALSGSTVTGFDDVSLQDPDFESIQSLAEAGIIRSKLLERKLSTTPNDLQSEGCVNFFPERNWLVGKRS